MHNIRDDDIVQLVQLPAVGTGGDGRFAVGRLYRVAQVEPRRYGDGTDGVHLKTMSGTPLTGGAIRVTRVKKV